MAETFGLTWWGQRWIAALEALGRAYANRLPRGRTYARSGAVTDLAIGAGQASARVAGPPPTPYRVSMAIPVVTDPQWTAAAHALARHPRHSATPLAAIAVHPEPTPEPTAGLRRVGLPRGFDSLAELEDKGVGAPTRAWQLAQHSDQEGPLLPALRERGSATVAELADAIGRPAAEIRLALRPLMTEGLVYRTGHAKTTRYHA